MSSIPPFPDMPAIDAAFVDLVLAFLQQVLFVPTPVRSAIRSLEITEMHESMARRYLYQQWAVTVILTGSHAAIGEKIFLVVDNRSGHYALKSLHFEPGWEPAREQST